MQQDLLVVFQTGGTHEILLVLALHDNQTEEEQVGSCMSNELDARSFQEFSDLNEVSQLVSPQLTSFIQLIKTKKLKVQVIN